MRQIRYVPPLLTALISAHIAHGQTENVTSGRGQVKEMGSKGETLFVVSFEHREKDGQPVATTIVHSDPSGKDLTREEVTFKNGKVVAFRQQHFQRGYESSVKVEGNQILMTWTENGKTEAKNAPVVENLVVGASVVTYLAQHVDEVVAGKPVRMAMAIPEHGRTYDFILRKTDKGCHVPKIDLCVKLDVDSFFLKPFVDTGYFSFRKKGTGPGFVLAGVTNVPALPRKTVEGELKAFISYIDY